MGEPEYKVGNKLGTPRESPRVVALEIGFTLSREMPNWTISDEMPDSICACFLNPDTRI